jgi:sigma-B regulation protein RsbU (phosphoserine phosphatase)
VLYSDGIVEAENKNQEALGDERLRQLVLENVDLPPAQMKEAILQSVYDFCQGVTQADDMTLMIVRMG